MWLGAELDLADARERAHDTRPHLAAPRFAGRIDVEHHLTSYLAHHLEYPSAPVDKGGGDEA